jgi:hypothetical protein
VVNRPRRLVSGGCSLLPLLLETFATEDGPSLRRLEGDGGLFATLGTCGASLGFGGRLSWNRRPQNGDAFCLAGLATFWLVFELLVVKEKLFARGKDKVRTAVDTLEYLVLEFHPSPHSPVALRRTRKRTAISRASCTQSRYTPPLEQLPLDSAHLRVTQVTSEEKL